MSFNVTSRAAPARAKVEMIVLPIKFDSNISAIGLPPPSSDVKRNFVPEFDAYLDALPQVVRDRLRANTSSSSSNNNNDNNDDNDDVAANDRLDKLRDELVEVIIDIGEPVQLVYRKGSNERLIDCVVDATAMQSTMDRWRAAKISVGRDNRVALAQTLHRISVKRDRNGDVDGLTCRVGK